MDTSCPCFIRGYLDAWVAEYFLRRALGPLRSDEALRIAPLDRGPLDLGQLRLLQLQSR